VLAAALGVLPFLAGFSTTRVFYVRDLSSFFWGRYLWLRREWVAGHFPLWDPHVGGGQAAYSDALNQMFLPPSILVRLLGNEVLGFNLWILMPFPIAAIGAWLLFSRRSSQPAATIGAAAFAMCGPIVSTGDFPNLSWSVAMMPWVMWAVDRLINTGAGRDAGVVAACVALQVLAGEPVTLFSTCLLALGYAVFCWASETHTDIAGVFKTAVAILLGAGLASVQLIPMMIAAVHADRSDAITADAWSLRPTALLETVWHHLSGDYFGAASLTQIPWMPLLNGGREPLLFSLYLGTPLLAVAVLGLAGRGPRTWRLFWVVAGFCSLVLAFGSYTPLYPVLRDHVPPFGSFRFPVKYLVVAMLALAAGVSLGFDYLWSSVGAVGSHPFGSIAATCRRQRRSLVLAQLTPALVFACAAGGWAACVFYPAAARHHLASFAQLLGDQKGRASAVWMAETIASTAWQVALPSAITLAIIALHTTVPFAAIRRVAAGALAVVLLADLQLHAQPVNPVLDASYLAPPAWGGIASRDRDARFYVGGKTGGTLEPLDIDASRGFYASPGLTAAASRAALNAQAAYYPSAWGGRELLSYDLPVIWPREFAAMVKKFDLASKERRDAFLDRAGVRFRILPMRRAGTHAPLMAIPLFAESFLFDWGASVAPRVAVVPAAVVVENQARQLESLFKPKFRRGEPVVLDRRLERAGVPAAASASAARIVNESSDAMDIDATVSGADGYLVVLDSYSDDWQAIVDGEAAPIARAHLLFRALHLAPGTHHVRFEYKPQALRVGVMLTLASLVVALVLLVSAPLRSRRYPDAAVSFAEDAA
jgi:hypothetical protein